MNEVRRIDLKTLAAGQQPPCASMYMPLHRSGRDIQEDPIRLKNLLTRAEELLVQQGLRRPDAKASLNGGWALHEDAGFWTSHAADGLAMFAAKDFWRHFALPHTFGEALTVNTKFHLSPVVQYLTDTLRFYVLSITKAGARLYRGSLGGLSPIKLPERCRVNPRELVASVQTRGPMGPEYQATAVRGQLLHGQRDKWQDTHVRAEFDKEILVEHFVHPVARAVDNLLGEEDAPVVLAGFEAFHEVIRASTSRLKIAEQTIAGNADDLGEEQLFPRALHIAQHWRNAELRKAAERYGDMVGQRRTVEGVEAVLSATAEARVAELFTKPSQFVWGRSAYEGGPIHNSAQPGDGELVQLAIERTLTTGGSVHVVTDELFPESARQAPMVAILRW